MLKNSFPLMFLLKICWIKVIRERVKIKNNLVIYPPQKKGVLAFRAIKQLNIRSKLSGSCVAG